MLTSTQLQLLSSGLGFIQSYNNAKIARDQGETDDYLLNLQADTLLANARRRQNQGVRESAEHQRQGRIMESDAVAAMAASGASVDPVMLARIKQKADANSMAAIYEANTAAIDMRYEAAMRRIQGDMQKAAGKTKSRNILTGAISTALTDWPKSVAQIPRKPTPGYGKPPSNLGFDRSG